LSYNHGNDIEDEEIDYDGMSEDIDTKAIDGDDDDDTCDEETYEEFYEAIYMYMMAIYALMHVVNLFLNVMRGEHVERPLTRRQITSNCLHKKIMFFIYQYIERGSLFSVLHDGVKAMKFNWRKRLNIVKGVASALSYLHHDFTSPIVHRDVFNRDVFTSNIL